MDGISRKRAAIAVAVSAFALLPGLAQAADPTDTKTTFSFNAPVQFMGDGTSFIVSLQHRGQEGRATPNTTDIVQVSGFAMP